MLSIFWIHTRKLEARIWEGDQPVYQLLTRKLEMKPHHSSQFIFLTMDEMMGDAISATVEAI